MDKQRKQELRDQFEQIKTHMGVIKITNNQNGKVFISAFPNLKNKWITIQMQLDMGQHPNAQLSKDWKTFGKDAFSYEVLEELETDKIDDVRRECRKLENKWLEALEPYDEAGYNSPPK